MNNQAFPYNHFCMKISKAPNSHQQETLEARAAFPDVSNADLCVFFIKEALFYSGGFELVS